MARIEITANIHTYVNDENTPVWQRDMDGVFVADCHTCGDMGFGKDQDEAQAWITAHECDTYWFTTSINADGVRVHNFTAKAYSGIAYDITQTDKRIHHGDVLVVAHEGIVGVMNSAWPTAVTTAHGAFHGMTTDAVKQSLFDEDAISRGLEAAIAIAIAANAPVNA